jgi:putative heme-binding domain-containing protein
MGSVPICLVACAMIVTQSGAAQDRTYDPKDVSAGAQMFRSHCARCHGVKGEGGIGPSLAAGVFYHGNSDRDLVQNISNGIPGTAMPGTFFDHGQVSQIVAYVRSLSRSPDAGVPPGNPKRGKAIFDEKGCRTCHLLRGEGGNSGPDLSTIGSQRSAPFIRESIVDPDKDVVPDYRVATIVLNDGNTFSGFVMNEDTYVVQLLDLSKGLQSVPKQGLKTYMVDSHSSMPSYKDQLSSDQLDDLVSYLCSLKRGRRAE